MFYSSRDMEQHAVLDTAARMCAAARTAPKTRGMDGLVSCVLTGEDKDQLAAQMRRLAGELDYAFFARDADNVDTADRCAARHAGGTARAGQGLSILSFRRLRRLRKK